jgi:hypothetical protein
MLAMGDLRGELERITAQFISSVLEAARAAPISELVAEIEGTSTTSVVRIKEPVRARRELGDGVSSASPSSAFPRGVRGAPTALKRAVEWQRQLDAGQIRSRAAIARREGLTRARVTQIMNLLRRSRRK